MPEPALRVCLLGQFQTAIGGVVLTAEMWRRKKASDVVKLLALQPQGRMQREQILEALWPELDEKSGMNNLHQTLHHARRLLEPNLAKGAKPRFLVFERDTLVLCVDERIEVDYQQFKRLLAQARRQPEVATYEAAVVLYQGDLLPQDLYEDWTEPQRDEVRALYLEALLELAGLLETAGNPTRAAHYLEQAIAKERTHEAAHLALMRIYAQTGRRMEAIQQFQTLREALVQELGEEPDEATRAVYEQVLQQLPNLPELPAPAQPQAAPTLSGSVPAALAPLIGRELALEETLQLLSVSRCLTLTGAGGSGKTRLALELATRLKAQYEGGVWWVELVALSDPQMILPTIAQNLGSDGKHLLQGIVEQLKGRTTLLVLDNCEHLIEDCAQIAVQLLKALPGLQLLITSRESLRIAGEIAWVVPPLEVPSAETPPNPALLGRLESVRLLVERIQQNNPKFKLNQQNAASLAQICRRLDGLPLALELAAARVGLLSVEQIAARLDNSLRLLTRGQRGGMRHHQTLGAALEWSYNLLSEAEKQLFIRLSVFVGGWTLEAAETVAAEALGVGSEDLPDLLSRLERVSMLQTSETGGGMRFRMLEPIRQFGFAQLEQLGLADRVRGQLLEWYVGQSETIVPKLSGEEQAYWYGYLVSEYENLRAALLWSKSGKLELGLHLAARLWRFWQVKGYAQELLAWFEETLPLAQQVATPIRADAYNSAGIMARTCGLYAHSARFYEQSLALRRELKDRRGEAVVLNNLGVSARDQADYPKVELYCSQSLTIAREIGDKNLEALGLMNLGVALRGQGDLEAAESHFKDSFALFKQLGEKRSLGTLYNFLGNIAQSQNQFLEAEHLYQQSLELIRELEDFWGLGISTHNLASLYLSLGQYPKAWDMLLQSFIHYRKAGVRHGLEECFETLARVAQKRNEPNYAAWAWGVVERLEGEIGKVITQSQQTQREQVFGELQAELGQQAFEDAKAAGQGERLEQAFERVATAS